MTARGWFTTRPDRARRKWVMIGTALLGAGVGGAALLTRAHLGLVPVPLALAGLALISGARWIPVRTAAGAAMTRRVKGFRRYIATTAVAQTPAADGRMDALYDYLPYAIAFGCTKEWADLTAELAGAAEPPLWLRTRPLHGTGGVASMQHSGFYFLTMHHFATTVNKSVTSVSASGQSGFSGGGFSGGGVGGGGGGSW